jgi:hypothetical protein
MEAEESVKTPPSLAASPELYVKEPLTFGLEDLK